MEHLPDINLLQKELINVEDLTFLDQGGFKAVYKGTIEGSAETIKSVWIPRDMN